MSVGFIGIGTMGLPMAARLLDSGTSLTLWNRTAERCAPLVAAGARQAATVDAVFATCSVILVMLLDQHAIDAVLGRHTPAFSTRVAGRTIVMLGTTSAHDSLSLAADVRACGGRYVEAPVSGSRIPAEQGALVGMLAGHADDVRAIEPLLRPLCRQIVRCGDVPNALRLKLAVNHYLIVTVAALAEAAQAASAAGVDVDLFRSVLDAGPMASDVSRMKLAKLAQGDFAPQASIRDVAHIATLVSGQALAAGADAPLIARCARQFAQAVERGNAELDMIGLLQPAPGAGDPHEST